MKLYSINIQDVIFKDSLIIWKASGTVEQMNEYISEKRQKAAAGFRFEADRKRSLCAGYLLNHAIHENYPAIQLPLETAYAEPNGKPYFQEYPEIQFNLSHSGDYAVCVLHDRPVGVDIEQCKHMKESIAKRFFAPEEYEDIIAVQDEQERTRRFYRYWVLKESFMKAVGLGLQLEMKAFRVCLGEQITYEHHINDKNYEARLYEAAEGYCMAVCTEV